ncbi:ABC transporter ATP-binding protein [Paeniglutamicibacter psychrophenolicus]|uniref:Osmoprotectant transport system ATP-binding protein n=1 Tax=Paeniglutamicibacter psychrophenolicus TaxID=257454 RepID=A0ABS4WEZ5_9MICC|nr:ABC transporter ATP-binding protein [Paeniglutamicibacter psychrophenolicus]MBP2374606.1 osmoprotectant transport system ATP-binding protein [Paeniglutamicibacter psychrophenolicus]
MITFESVSKLYPGGTQAVTDLDLQIATGSFTVLVGPSGCGKTTSMRMINRMVAPTSGRILIDGQDVADIRAVTLRLGIGYVLQNAGLFPHRTVLDNIATVQRLLGLSKAQARAKAHEAMERVGLDASLATRYPAQLSGGQKQRVGVARALAADPPILLMDEPFSAVDPIVRLELQQEVAHLQAEIKKTIVMVTHDIDEALILGDRIAVLAPGGVLHQYASPIDILARPATDFVASLVAKDRGFRALSFETLTGLGTTALPVPGPEGLIDMSALAPGWGVRVNRDSGTAAWIDADGAVFGPHPLVPADASLRTGLDAVLASPTSAALLVDGTGNIGSYFTLADLGPLLRPNEQARA